MLPIVGDGRPAKDFRSIAKRQLCEGAIIWNFLPDLKTDGQKIECLGFSGHVFEYYVGWIFQTYSLPAFNTVH